MMLQVPRQQSDEVLSQILDPDQLKAVKHRGANLLIIAGAGSGKTHTLAHRAVSFLQEVRPDNLMVITFTRKAANEILNRIAEYSPDSVRKDLKRAWIGTIHSICWRMLKENGHLVNLKPNWSVLDMPESERVMALSAKPFGFTSDEQAKEIYRLYSYSRNSMTSWKDLLKSQRFLNVPNSPDDIERAIESYKRRCARSARVDFDDLQVLALKLLRDNFKARIAYQERFKVIMVDEYQDTNLIQSEILKLLAAKNNVITVVGDDAQSIYGFRAATIENILRFERDFKADKVTLQRNYRSTPEIVEFSNHIILNNKNQFIKNIRSAHISFRKPVLHMAISQADEAYFVVKEISERMRQGINLDEMAVLFRATRQAAQLQIELQRANIPYVLVGGDDFFTLEHVKIVMDMLRLLLNPDDSIALSAVLDLTGRISASDVEAIESQADKRQLSFWDMVKSGISDGIPLQGAEYRSLTEFKRQIDQLRELIVDGESITPVISGVLKLLEPYLKKRHGHNWSEVQDDYSVLQSIASQFTSLGDFLSSIALERFADTESPRTKLILSTIHSAKGLEWDTVFVIGLVEFWFPLNLAIQQTGTDEEERRLFYVAATRAKKMLFLSTFGVMMDRFGSPRPAQISRFIKELPESVYEIDRSSY